VSEVPRESDTAWKVNGLKAPLSKPPFMTVAAPVGHTSVVTAVAVASVEKVDVTVVAGIVVELVTVAVLVTLT